MLPEYRGRGVYRSLVSKRARDAVDFGAQYLQVDALPTSRPILERLEFLYPVDDDAVRVEGGKGRIRC